MGALAEAKKPAQQAFPEWLAIRLFRLSGRGNPDEVQPLEQLQKIWQGGGIGIGPQHGNYSELRVFGRTVQRDLNLEVNPAGYSRATGIDEKGLSVPRGPLQSSFATDHPAEDTRHRAKHRAQQREAARRDLRDVCSSPAWLRKSRGFEMRMWQVERL